jgi:hypothetical protein
MKKEATLNMQGAKKKTSHEKKAAPKCKRLTKRPSDEKEAP